MTDKGQRTIAIKWVRSGIGFSRRQKQMIRSLGLRRLNQVTQRPDTPPIRGLVARIPHLVEIVSEPSKPAAWTAVPEYTLRPPAVAPVESPPLPVAVSVQQNGSSIAPSEAQEPVAQPVSTEIAGKPPIETAAPSRAVKAKKPAKPAAAVKSRALSTKTEKGKASRGKVAPSRKRGKK